MYWSNTKDRSRELVLMGCGILSKNLGELGDGELWRSVGLLTVDAA